MIGGIQAEYDFTASSLFPAHPGITSVFFFTGTSKITMKDGSRVTGMDAGALDLNPSGDGHFGSLITFVAGASGHIVLTANADLAAGVVSGDYTGELCTP
ncbi:MAG: hypothetical protein AABZ10_07945 [Nitrospirota bacterium]